MIGACLGEWFTADVYGFFISAVPLTLHLTVPLTVSLTVTLTLPLTVPSIVQFPAPACIDLYLPVSVIFTHKPGRALSFFLRAILPKCL